MGLLPNTLSSIKFQILYSNTVFVDKPKMKEKTEILRSLNIAASSFNYFKIVKFFYPIIFCFKKTKELSYSQY